MTAAVVGILAYTSIPTHLDFWRLVTSLSTSYFPQLVGLTPALHDGIPWRYTWEEFYQSDLKGKTAIVTGANSGIGYDLCEALAKVGADVIMVCRNESKCHAARSKILKGKLKGSITTMTMDTASFASVRGFGETFVPRQQRIDMLFLNAGTNYNFAPGDSTDCGKKTERDGIDYLFQVNYLSHHLLYRLLEPLLAENAKIVQTSSASSFSTFSYILATDLETLHGCSEKQFDASRTENYAYGQSKLAQIVWVKALTRKLGPTSKLAANAFHPGLVNTPLVGRMMDSLPFNNYIRRLLNGVTAHAWQSPDGALTGLYLAVTDGIKGRYFHPQAQEVVNPMSLDEQLQDKLWAFSERLVENYLAPIEPVKVEPEAIYGLPPHEEPDTDTEEEKEATTLEEAGAVSTDE
jgi:NAD(P)-dependent dehydrogenase (short-subunit alcohol dehydrogenase family)